jgi:hypothetical protein
MKRHRCDRLRPLFDHATRRNVHPVELELEGQVNVVRVRGPEDPEAAPDLMRDRAHVTLRLEWRGEEA